MQYHAAISKCVVKELAWLLGYLSIVQPTLIYLVSQTIVLLLLCTAVRLSSKYKVSHVLLSCISTEKFRWRYCSTEVHNLGKYYLQGSQVTIFGVFDLYKRWSWNTFKIKS